MNDVAYGGNGVCTDADYVCTAGPGYDGVTGLGTPNGLSAFGGPGSPTPIPGDFTLHVTPTSSTVPPGKAAKFKVTATATGGYTAPILLFATVDNFEGFTDFTNDSLKTAKKSSSLSVNAVRQPRGIDDGARHGRLERTRAHN